MSNVSVFSQVDREREAFLEQQRHSRAAADERRRRRMTEQEERIRQRQASSQARPARQEVSRRQERDHAREQQRARAEREREAAELRQMEDERRRLAEEARRAQEEARWVLERSAMSWSDLGLVVKVAQAQGYRLVAATPLRDGAQQQAVTARLERPGRPPVGLVRHDKGVEVVSHDRELRRSFVQPVAQGYTLEKAVTGLRARGFQAEVVRTPQGELRIQASRHVQVNH